MKGFLFTSYGLAEPMFLNSTIVNTSNGDLIGCKNLASFATRLYPLSLLCNLSQTQLPAWPLEMACQTANFTAYFNDFSQNVSKIKTLAIPKPQRAYELYNADLITGWAVASAVSGFVAASYGCCLTDLRCG